MTEISRSALFGRLNKTALKAIETATGFCKVRGNPYVELVHWVHVMVQDSQNDLAAIRREFGIDDTKLARDIVASLDALPRGATSISDFSPQIEEAIEKGWLYASLQFSASRVRTGHLLFGMLKTATLKNALGNISSEWRKVQADKLGDEFERICAASTEETQAEAGPVAGGGAGDGGPVADGEALAKYSVDLTEQARSGKIDKIVGRDAEIRQVIDILLRRRQNNPILVGEAGVGKTAVVEGFAKRIVDGDVPPALQGVTLRSLDIGLMQAGASVKGEFEKRLRQVIDEVEASTSPIILFIDEAHTLIGAGGQAGTGDAANLLKPALARGRLRTVAATTYAEYRQYFEKDPALTRRFQTVDVGEPETAKAIAMIRSVAPMMEAHHKIVVLDEAVEAAVKLSQRYVPARQLPDKAVSLLDTACARVAVSQHATPAQVEDRKRKLELLEVEREIAQRETSEQYASGERLPKLDEAIAEAKTAVEEVSVKWDAEKAAHEAVVAARSALSEARAAAGEDGVAEGEEALKAALDSAIAAMREAQGDNPMVFGVVDQDAVAAVVGDWTGIPMGRMVKNEIESVLTIADQLKARVIGQDHAMDAIAKRIQTSRAKLDNPNKPVGVFMLCGPSGVGKTETAMVLADLLFSGDESCIVINMSEFQEAHTVSTLKGAPAGYVGYGQGGVLTEAVRRRPYSVVLLDEVEKAHPDVHEMFFQVFDKGFMNDAEGRYIDFKNTLILLTSNVGTDLITTLSEDEEMKPDADSLATTLRPELLKVFPPALLGRLLVLPYYPLSPDMLKGIVRIQLDRIVRRVHESHGIMFSYADAVIDLIVSRCNEVASGGRLIDAILTNTMLPEVSIALLNRQMSGEEVKSIAVTVEGDGFGYAFG
ncbi:type VI secretion system ATPase TssH [Novosphingobium sp. Chol11]|uniref:type VI secretion system ATPase TssH n=1 Tax=Novosphingobium sp. Chol11 TaxID=1385763 RepID=UPI0025D05818|nr:type VI secretion system ATPase TssH [Novosphingobium sp. Chol11]